MVKLFGYDPDALGLQRGKYANGNKLHVKCPFHDGSGSSATFYLDTGILHCYKCSNRFNVSKIAHKTGGRIQKGAIEIKAKDDLDNWKSLLGNEVDASNEYLLKRLVTPEQIKQFNIRVTEKGVAIPITDLDGKDVGIIVRQTDDYIRYLYGGVREPLWPAHSLATYDPNDVLYVVEGVFGVLRGLKYGHNVVSTLGAMVKKEVAPYLIGFTKVIGVFDNDDAGYIGGARLLKFVPQARIFIPGYPVDEADEEIWGSFSKGILTRDVSKLKSFVKKQDMFERFS